MESNYLSQQYKTFKWFVIALTLLFLIWDKTMAIGWLSGNGVFIISLGLKHWYVDALFSQKRFNTSLFMLHTLANIVLISVGLWIGFVRPHILNPFVFSLGVLAFKMYLYAVTIANLKGGKTY